MTKMSLISLQSEPNEGARIGIPKVVWSRLRSFLLDELTGNMTLNIKDGRILSFHIEESVIVPRPERRP